MDRQTDGQSDGRTNRLDGLTNGQSERRTDGQKPVIRTDFTYPGRRKDGLERLEGQIDKYLL